MTEANRSCIAAEGLLPSSTGARVRFSGRKRTVIDGPFTEAKEEAIEWVKRCPNPHDADFEIEAQQMGYVGIPASPA